MLDDFAPIVQPLDAQTDSTPIERTPKRPRSRWDAAIFDSYQWPQCSNDGLDFFAKTTTNTEQEVSE
jgi:hypothetical protein